MAKASPHPNILGRLLAIRQSLRYNSFLNSHPVLQLAQPVAQGRDLRHAPVISDPPGVWARRVRLAVS